MAKPKSAIGKKFGLGNPPKLARGSRVTVHKRLALVDFARGECNGCLRKGKKPVGLGIVRLQRDVETDHSTGERRIVLYAYGDGDCEKCNSRFFDALYTLHGRILPQVLANERLFLKGLGVPNPRLSKVYLRVGKRVIPKTSQMIQEGLGFKATRGEEGGYLEKQVPIAQKKERISEHEKPTVEVIRDFVMGRRE